MDPVVASTTTRAAEVVKSQQDTRLYRALTLPNRLKVIVISDPETEKSGASMDVHVGSMLDPRDVPGLAHFCEHMLFLGTEKYPDENEYSRFLSQHGGGSNAYTAGDHTNFYFDVLAPHLEEAVDRFSQFFLKPLFTESATDREVNAVNSEHEKNAFSDSWRINQMEHFLCDPEHDFCKFGTGTRETLSEIPKSKGIDVRQELLKFHDKWYSSNIMSLALLGKESLDELEAMAVKYFSGIENLNIEVPYWSKHPIRPEDTKKITYIVPVKDLRNLHISFPLPDLLPYYKTSPGHYLSHLIGHEGGGSLLSELKARSWVNNLVAGQGGGCNGFDTFFIQVDLTDEGIEHIDDIISLAFQYINMVKKSGPLQWVFDECRQLNEMNFRFKDKEKPQRYVSALAPKLHDYPLEEILCANYFTPDWKPELIKMVSDLLVPSNARIFVVGHKFESICTEVEKWYGTKYKVEPIPEEKLREWATVVPSGNLHIHQPNSFIPTNFELAKRTDDQGDLITPVILRDTSLTRLWFKQDNEFLLPKAHVDLEIFSPVAYADPHSSNLAYMFVRCVRDELTEMVYEAELAQLYYSFSSSKFGVQLNVQGFNEKLAVLLERIVTKVLTLKADETRFNILKENYERTLRNFRMEQPSSHAVFYSTCITSENCWLQDELISELPNCTVEALNAFVPRLLAKVHLELFVHGNVCEEDALRMADVVEASLQQHVGSQALCRSQTMRQRRVMLPEGPGHVFATTNEVHKSSCIEMYLESGQTSNRANVILELLSHMLKEPCFDVLRTKEQLGYIVHSNVRRSCGVQGLKFLVQSERHPEYVESRIEAFLVFARDFIEKMPPEEFEKNKEALKNIRLEKPKKLSERNARIWSEIFTHHWHFNRDQVEVEELATVTRQDVLDLFDSCLAADSNHRRKLSCHVVSMAEDGAGKAKDQEQVTLQPPPKRIEDIWDFKARLPLYPILRPCAEPLRKLAP